MESTVRETLGGAQSECSKQKKPHPLGAENLPKHGGHVEHELVDNPGYHITHIAKGEVGEISKIQEEVDELKDAAAQGVRIMELVELSDLLGAVEAYLERHHAGISMEDLLSMSAVTQRAFRSGRRS